MIRVGLLGFGMGSRVFHAPLISSVDGLELAAVLERTSNKAAERYPGITVYRSLTEMLADESLSLFVVATPNNTHYPLAKEILSAIQSAGCERNRGLAGLVIDKPMTMTSAEAADLIGIARKHNVLLAPFFNRRWDSDFLTIKNLLHEDAVGTLVNFESRFDRWRPARLTERLWKEDEASGGMLQDLGPHLADQALALFGLPQAVSAEVLREREGEGPNDSFTIRLRYPRPRGKELTVTIASNLLSLPPRPRFHLRGTHGGYVKTGVDPQEAALNKITRIADDNSGSNQWGHEPAANWGILHTGIDGGSVSRPVPAIPGDYRLYYAAIRDALLGKSAPPVTAIDAWRVARLLEYAQQSSDERREISCDWSDEPE
jgi:scyllo-inositol 2-dehydrogenase (NADP+)